MKGKVFAQTVLILGILNGCAGEPLPTRTSEFAGLPLNLAAARRLSQAIRIKTISHDDPGKANDTEFRKFRRFLETTYPTFHRVSTRETFHRHSALHSWRGRNPNLAPILLLAHQDVVPAGRKTDHLWTHPPFSGIVSDGFVWGRGALDMKGQLIGLFEALEFLARSGFQPQRTILVALGEDEETGGLGAQAIAAALKRRNVKAEFVLDEGPMILDPFSLTGKAAGFIGVAEKGYGTISVVARDKEGHSSTPPKDPAVERLAEAILAIQDIRFEQNIDDVLHQTLTTLALDFDGISRVAVSNLWAFGALVKRQLTSEPAGSALLGTTIAPTVLEASQKENVLPEFAKALFNVRIHPRDNSEHIFNRVSRAVETIDGISVSWVGTPSKPPPVTDTRSNAYQLLRHHAAAIAGNTVKIAPVLVFGATDSRFYGEISQTILRFQPLVISQDELTSIHGVNERISVENLTRTISFYRGLIKDATGGAQLSVAAQ